ncbi:hypothetical protein ACFX14_035210 [Malus domestica]
MQSDYIGLASAMTSRTLRKRLHQEEKDKRIWRRRSRMILMCLYVGIIQIGIQRSDVIEIETPCQGEGRIGTRCDWILNDYAISEVIGRVTRPKDCEMLVP